MTSSRRTLVLALAAPLLAAAGSACYVEDSPGYAAYPPESYEGYVPEYYNGYVVYYDDFGRPYYYDNGVSVWISPGEPRYHRYVDHWRTHGAEYRRWNTRYGARYHRYHR